MAVELQSRDFVWLGEVRAAADCKASLMGVPLNVKARLTTHGLVRWISPSAITITSEGRRLLDDRIAM